MTFKKLSLFNYIFSRFIPCIIYNFHLIKFIVVILIWFISDSYI